MNLTAHDLLSLHHILVHDLHPDRSFKVTGISTDSRTAKHGEVFIALRGENFDGHDFITKAIQAGASVLIVEKRWADSNAAMMASLPLPRLVVENGVAVLGELARVYRRKFKIPVVVIGGSNGKTTTKEMIRAVLASKYNVLCTEGNQNNHIGVPQTLFRLRDEHEIVVLEFGTNHHGEIAYLCSVAEPTHGLITNIGREHLEFLKSINGVAKAEGELFDWIRTNNPRGRVFVNADDNHIPTLAKGIKNSVTYGITAKRADVRGSVQRIDENGCAYLRLKPKGKSPIELQLSVPGAHNAHNALAAATVGLSFNVSGKQLESSLSAFTAASKRMEVLKVDGITILNDTYNSNPDSTMVALQTLNDMETNGKRIAVLADMLELGSSAEVEHRRIGKAVAKYRIEYLLTYGILSRFTHDVATTQFKAHYEQKNMLAEYVAELLAAGDIVLIKGSRGMKMEDVVTFLKERFSKAA